MITFSASSLQTRNFEFQTQNFEFTNTKFRVYKLEISSLHFQTRNFEFTNTKFRVYKHEISSLQTRKFRVCKLEISSLQTRNFKFINSKFQVYKLEILSFKRSLGYQVRCSVTKNVRRVMADKFCVYGIRHGERHFDGEFKFIVTFILLTTQSYFYRGDSAALPAESRRLFTGRSRRTIFSSWSFIYGNTVFSCSSSWSTPLLTAT